MRALSPGARAVALACCLLALSSTSTGAEPAAPAGPSTPAPPTADNGTTSPACSEASLAATTSARHSRHRALAARPRYVPPEDTYFVVDAHDFSEHCGGCMVLHRLCDRLNVMFADVRETPLCYLVSTTRGASLQLNPGYKTPLLPPWLDAAAGIVVYPEVRVGNPLGSDRVVHWILYFPGLNGGPPASGYDPRDLVACFSPGFCAGFDAASHRQVPLRVLDYEFGHYLNVPRPPGGRAGAITFRHKEVFSSPTLGTVRTSGTFPVAEHPLADGGKRSRIEQYGRAERFYSMDPATFRSVEAAMAGTPSVVVPVPGVAKAEWLASVGDEFRFGVAYGDADLPHAVATLPCVMPRMRAKAAQERETVEDFVRLAVAYFDGDGGGGRG